MVDWIESCDPEIYELDLVSNYPKKVLGLEHRSSTLEELGLYPEITLFTKEHCESD